MSKNEEVQRPQGPLAHHLQLFDCGDPTCGIHIVSFNENDRPICETVISLDVMEEHMLVYYDVLKRKGRIP